MKSLARVLSASLRPYLAAAYLLALAACFAAGWWGGGRWYDAHDDRRSLRAAIAERDSIIASDRAWLRRDVARADSLTRVAQAADARALAAEQRYHAARGRVRVVGPVVLAAADTTGAGGAAPDTLATDPRVAQALVACDSAIAAGEAARLQALVALDTTRQALAQAETVIAQQDTALALRDSLLAIRTKRPRFGFRAGVVTGVVLTVGAAKVLTSLTAAGLRRAFPGA